MGSRVLGLAMTMAAALVACAGVRSSHSDAYNARRGLAHEMLRRGEWGSAFELVNGLHREDPRDADVLVMRALIYREQNLLKEALADLEEAVAIAPKLASAHSGIAIVYDRLGRAGAAVEHHRLASELEPTNPSYLNNLGFTLLAHGKAREAIAVLREALRLDPTSARIRNNLGFAYAKLGDFHSAAEHFFRGAAPAEAKNNLGFAYQTVGNLAQAYDLYVEALRLDPDLGKARENLREVATRIGRPIPADVERAPRS
jgi:Flp pilus assembly protein TadD